jgi:hypothetical protein
MFITVLRITREYGGPEEGGWWYDDRQVLFERKTTKRIAKKMAKLITVEVCRDNPGREVSFINEPKNVWKKVQSAYRKRNRSSVIGGPDYEVIVTKRRIESTNGRPRYE